MAAKKAGADREISTGLSSPVAPPNRIGDGSGLSARIRIRCIHIEIIKILETDGKNPKRRHGQGESQVRSAACEREGAMAMGGWVLNSAARQHGDCATMSEKLSFKLLAACLQNLI